MRSFFGKFKNGCIWSHMLGKIWWVCDGAGIRRPSTDGAPASMAIDAYIKCTKESAPEDA